MSPGLRLVSLVAEPDRSQDEASKSVEVADARSDAPATKAKRVPPICHSERPRRRVLPPDLWQSGWRPAASFFAFVVDAERAVGRKN